MDHTVAANNRVSTNASLENMARDSAIFDKPRELPAGTNVVASLPHCLIIGRPSIPDPRSTMWYRPLKLKHLNNGRLAGDRFFPIESPCLPAIPDTGGLEAGYYFDDKYHQLVFCTYSDRPLNKSDAVGTAVIIPGISVIAN